MEIIDRGSGMPLVLIPGIQGRWEYLRPTVEALSAFFRVLTFHLCGERVSGLPFDTARGLDNYTEQVERALAMKHLSRGVICGVSFGGLVALRFAATHPASTDALVLASTPGPGWHLRPRHELYARLPWIFGPLFLAETPWRVRAEMKAAFTGPGQRRAFSREVVRTLITSPLSVSRMAARAQLISAANLCGDCSHITVPTLVVTGERALDHVVPTDASSEYARIIPGARTAVLERTGHLGSITRPQAFAALVRDFVVSPERESLRSSACSSARGPRAPRAGEDDAA